MSDARGARLIVAVLIGLFLAAAGGVYAMLRPHLITIPTGAASPPPPTVRGRVLRPHPITIPTGADAYTIVQYRRDMLKFNRRTMVEPYAKLGVRDAAWDEAATRYLERNALAFSCQLDPPKDEELAAEGKALVEKGCTDPMVLYCYATRLQNLGKIVPAEAAMRRAVEGFEKTPYPRARAWFAAARLSELCDKLDKNKEVDRWRDLAVKWAGEAGSEIREADHEPTVYIDLLLGRWDTTFDKQWRKLYEGLKKNPKSHPYLVDFIGGWCEIEEAWQARGPGWASEVTEQGWKGFYRHLAEAEKLLRRAWQKYPHYPEAPGQMVYVVMGQTQDEERQRIWFERSVTAHLDHGLPYGKLLWALRPRWGGSHEAMYEVGKACLETGRFDTNVPRWYLQSVYDIWEDSERKSDVWQWHGVYENLTKMCEGYIKAAETERQRDYYRTLLAQLAWFTGHYEEARRAFEELGDKAQPVVFSDWNLRSSLEDARGTVFASTEVDPAKLKQAGKLQKQGKYAQARAIYEELLRQAKSEYASAYLRQDLAVADLQACYQEGQWVSIQPDATFSGWVKEQGRWEVEPDGALKGTAGGEGFYLVNYSNFGGRLAVRGEVEFATDPAEGGQQEAGLFLDSATTEDDDWGYDFVNFRVSPTEGTVSVARRHETKGRVIVKTKVGRRAEFAVQLWNGVVSTWLDGRPIHRQVKIKDGASPSPAGIAIATPYPGGVYRFRNLQIRKLTEQPVPAPVASAGRAGPRPERAQAAR